MVRNFQDYAILANHWYFTPPPLQLKSVRLATDAFPQSVLDGHAERIFQKVPHITGQLVKALFERAGTADMSVQGLDLWPVQVWIHAPPALTELGPNYRHGPGYPSSCCR